MNETRAGDAHKMIRGVLDEHSDVIKTLLKIVALLALLLCLVSALLPSAARAASVSGPWSGTLQQDPPAYAPDYSYSMSLTENAGGAVSGTSRITLIGQPQYYAVFSLTGQVSGSTFSFQETGFVSQIPPPGSHWCLKSGTLSFSPNGGTLSGSWQAPGCSGGTITLTNPANLGINCPTACAGDPINAGTGNQYDTEIDFTGAAHTQLSLARYYNSQDASSSGFGANWHSTWHRGLIVASGGGSVTVTRADGRQDTFTKNGSGMWVPNPDVTSVLTPVPATGTQTGWKLVTADDTVEKYSLGGYLITVITRSGLVTTLGYDANNHLSKVTGPFGHVLSFTVNANGNVATMTTPNGGVYTYAYDAFGNLASVTYPDATVRAYVYENTQFPNFLTGIIDEKGNRFATYAYDGLGRATSTQHAGGADLTTVAYNSDGSTSVTDARGNVHGYSLVTQFGMVKPATVTGVPSPSAGGKAFTYDANGFIASRTDWDGNLTTYTHDSRGDETSRVEASGTALARTISTTWLSTFHSPTLITEPNRSTAFTYDARGNLLTKEITAGALTRSFAYTYTAFGQVLTATDPRGNITSYAYDAKGDLTSVTDALGHVTSITSYDANGRPLTIVDPNGVTTSLTYDPRGRLTSRTVGTLKTAYAYNKTGNLNRVTQPDGSYLAYSYDKAHRLTGIADTAGDHIVYTLDAASNRIMEQAFDTAGMLSRTRSYTYNAVNRLKEMIGAQGQTTVYAHDKQGNLTAVTDPLNHATNYAYDALNRLGEAIDAKGGTTFYGYNVHDDLKSVLDPRNLKTAYAWDGLDDQLQLASPDTGVTNRTFDAAGNVTSSTDARGNTTTYSYDALNRRTHALFADGTSAAWHYDQGANGIGRLTKIRDVTGSTHYSYDANGHVTEKKQIVGAVTLTTIYGYDAGGRLASITYPSGKEVAYAYDAAGRVSSVTLSGHTLVAGVTYLPFGMASGWTAGNGAVYQRTFDLDGRITGLALPAGDNIGLSYDAASRITGRTESGFPAESFTYNTLDRLHIYASGVATKTYTYDASGNRTGDATNATPPVSLAYNIDTVSNRLLGISGSLSESFTYDATGNMLSYSAPFADYHFSYDARNRQTEAFVGAIGTSFLINGLGQRIAQINVSVPEFLFVYDEAGHLIGKYDGSGNLLQETAWLGDLPVAVLEPAGRFYIAPDHLGAPHQITDAGGAAVWQWHPDPFGKGDPSGTFSYDLRFPGQFFDQATRLHYNYFRDYDPRLGRYIESDPIGLRGGVNTYAYAGGNPVTYTDRTGLSILDELEVYAQQGLAEFKNGYSSAYERSAELDKYLDATNEYLELPWWIKPFAQTIEKTIGATAYANPYRTDSESALNDTFNQWLFSLFGLDSRGYKEFVTPPISLEESLKPLYQPKETIPPPISQEQFNRSYQQKPCSN